MQVVDALETQQERSHLHVITYTMTQLYNLTLPKQRGVEHWDFPFKLKVYTYPKYYTKSLQKSTDDN